MYFKSIKDLSNDIEEWIPRLPRNIDCLVGIPRSGMLVATILALKMNLPLTDLEGLLAGRVMESGRRLDGAAEKRFFATHRTVLVVDDSVASGRSMREAKQAVAAAGLPHGVLFGSVYGVETDSLLCACDLPKPRRFEWNILATKEVAEYCFDMDGVLCCDPGKAENDDGERYLRFIREAVPLYLPSHKIGHIVTSRLERFRKETEEWLDRHRVVYKSLIMLDLPTRAERVRSGAAIPFKAKAYRATGASLFIESDCRQAQQIATLSGQYVYSVDRRVMVPPGGLASFTHREGRALEKRLRRKVKGWVKFIHESGGRVQTGEPVWSNEGER